jgi:hypothetical protein
MKHYLPFWFIFTACLLLSVGIFNLIVDPYGIFRFVDNPGFNSVKPRAGSHGAVSKAYQVLHVRPKGLILGNSRAEVGFDPMHPAWPTNAHPVYNLALPGTGTHISLQYLQHVLANAKKLNVDTPKVVVWGIDIMDFLVDSKSTSPQKVRRKVETRLLGDTENAVSLSHVMPKVRDYAEATLTLDAFFDSIQTVANQRNPYSEDLTAHGFNPMRDYIKITANEGYASVFLQKDIANIKNFSRRPKGIFDSGGFTSQNLEDLRTVIRLCKQNGIDLKLVIYPYHAHLLEIFRITGQWPSFGNWKRELVKIVAEESSSLEKTSVTLWDFSQFSEITEETTPSNSNQKTKMKWYWEAGHFKKELGDLVLNRVFNHPGAWQIFGVNLNLSNLEKIIATERVREMDYRVRHPIDVSRLEKIYLEMSPRR